MTHNAHLHFSSILCQSKRFHTNVTRVHIVSTNTTDCPRWQSFCDSLPKIAKTAHWWNRECVKRKTTWSWLALSQCVFNTAVFNIPFAPNMSWTYIWAATMATNSKQRERIIWSDSRQFITVHWFNCFCMRVQKENYTWCVFWCWQIIWKQRVFYVLRKSAQ